MTKEKGFSLIEMLVVVGILMVVLVVITGMISNSFKLRNRTNLVDELERSGGWILSELKKNILAAKGTTVGCPVGSYDTKISYDSVLDGNSVDLECVDGVGIASASGTREYQLLPMGLGVSGCNQFVTCSTSPESPSVTEVNFDFYLTIGTSTPAADSFVKKEFKSKVGLRN